MKIFVSILLLIFLSGCSPKNNQPIYRQTTQSFEVRANDLMKRLTLEQKISQLMYDAPAIDSLGIQKYNWWNECLHGVARAGLATVFPQPIGLAAMFDDSAMFQMADIISTEARAKHHEFARKGERDIYQGLTFWSPNINIFRDPRWGRGMETYGEDPYLTARNGVAFVKGLQGNDPKYFKVIATAKHFAVHSGPESTRHSFNAIIDERDFRETYTPAFEALVKEGGAYSVMCAYNRFKGEACCGSNKLLNELLRKEWGFKGYVVSDCWAINDIWDFHKITDNKEEGVALAIKSGTDLECGNSYVNLLGAVKNGLVAEAEIDTAFKRLMIARFKLGMFDPDKDVAYSQIPYSVVDCDSHKAKALEIARKSIVLLKNENNLLPLNKNLRKILVCGPNANNKFMLLGNYNGIPSNYSTPLNGIKEKLGSATEVIFEQGCGWVDNLVVDNISAEFLQIDGKKGFKAEYFDNINLTGNPILTRYEELIGFKTEGGEIAPGVKNKNCSARWTSELTAQESGEYTFVVNGDDDYRLYIDSKIIVDQWTKKSGVPNYAKIKFEKAKKYNIKLEFYNKEWNGEISLGWIATGKTSEVKALEQAKTSDVVIMFAGITPSLEGEEMPVKIEGFNGGDRTLIGLPKVQTEFLKKLKATGKPIVLVLLNGSALAINWENDNIPAILEAWYPGQAAGTAIADILFGDYNPAGRLPVTFYKSEKDLPPFDDYRMKGRTYRYFEGEPLYAFGYGLSFTTFEYSNLVIPKTIETGKSFEGSVNVKNTGKFDGDEVVQIYLKDLESSVNVTLHSLVGFRRIHLNVGESKKVSFTVSPHQMSLLNNDFERIIEPGLFEIYVGGCQPSIKSSKNLVSGKIEATGKIVLVK